jgi:hypothetical protein
VIDDTIRRLADTWEGPEARAGIMAFLEKKVAPWLPGGTTFRSRALSRLRCLQMCLELEVR